jgi:hypothetical protein
MLPTAAVCRLDAAAQAAVNGGWRLPGAPAGTKVPPVDDRYPYARWRPERIVIAADPLSSTPNGCEQEQE